MSTASGQSDPVALARKALMAAERTSAINLADCIATIVNDALWRLDNIHSSFGKFAVRDR